MPLDESLFGAPMSAPALNGQEPIIKQGFPGLVWKVFNVFALLAALSVCIFVFGSIYGERISHAGHSLRQQPLEIFIGNDVYSIPENMIRHADQRQPGEATKFDIYVHWPSVSGYTVELAPAFREQDPKKMELVLASVTQRHSLLDMAERFEPVYRNAIRPNQIRQLSNGLYIAPLASEFGYINERLVYSRANVSGKPAFIARCQSSVNDGSRLLLPCETDIFIGHSSEAKIRFASSQLMRWEAFTKELEAFKKSIMLNR